MPDEAWERLAELVRARRIERELTQAELASVSRTSESTVRSIEKGGRGRSALHPSTRRAISQALGWTPDGIDRILAGDEPIAAPNEAPRPSTEERLRRLETLAGVSPGDVTHLTTDERLARLEALMSNRR